VKTYSNLIALSAIVALTCMAGCAKKTPAEVQSDVAKVEAAGQKNVADVQRAATEKESEARSDVAAARTDVAHEDAVGTRRVTIAEAEAAHKVALERCTALSGDEKSHCQSVADADFARAKANAEAVKVASDPKG
jgi:predicted small lipoprotein YifL